MAFTIPAITLWLALTAAGASRAFELTILHTNDFHARVQETDKYSHRCSEEAAKEGNCYGGSARIKTMVDEWKARAPNNTILLSGGDQFQGTLWYTKYGGVILAKFMNLIGYDGMAVGHHEFDDGVSGLEAFAKKAEFPILSSNLDLENATSLKGLVLKSKVLDVGGEKVGVVGYTSKETGGYLTTPETVEFKDELGSVQTEVDKLTAQGINKIIALGNAGFIVDKHLAANLKDVDVVVGGHSNTFLYTGEQPSNNHIDGPYPFVVENPNQPKGVPVVQDYAYGKYLGELTLTFDDQGVVTNWTGNPILLDNSVAKDAQVMALINQSLPELDAFYQSTIGHNAVLMESGPCLKKECLLGNLVTDAMVRRNLRHSDQSSWSDVTMAVYNGGGFGAGLARGPISTADVEKALPYRDAIDIIQVKGSILRRILEHGASKLGDDFGGFLQVSGIQVTFDDRKPPYHRVVELLVLCSQCQVPKLEPVVDNQLYKLIIADYTKEGGDSFDFILSNIVSQHLIGDQLSQMIVDYVNQSQVVYPTLENRIQFLKDVEKRDSFLGQLDKCAGETNGGEAVFATGASPAFIFMTLLLSCLLTVL